MPFDFLVTAFADLSNPTTQFTLAFVTVTFLIYLGIGWYSRVAESKGFYVAGQGVPAIANGAATAADWMSAASFLSMAGAISILGSDGSVFLMGWTGGYVLLALLLAPYLRKFGKYTVPDFVGERYYSETARVVAAVCAIFVSITYVAGQMNGVGIVFSRIFEVPHFVGVIVGMAIVAFFAVLGGMKGITWTQVVQYFVLIFAFVVPAIALSSKLTGNSVPQVGMLVEAVSDQLGASAKDNGVAQLLDGKHEELGFADYTRPFASKYGPQLNVLCITFALMAGTAGLPHVIVRFYTVSSVRAARYSAGWALLFIALLYTTAPALAMFARYNIINNLHGAAVDHVDVVVTENGTANDPQTFKIHGVTPDERTAALAAIDDIRAKQQEHDGLVADAEKEGRDPPPPRSTKFHYFLRDKKDGQIIEWVGTWQTTDLVKLSDNNSDGYIQVDALIVPPSENPDGEVTFKRDMRGGRLWLLDGAKISSSAEAGSGDEGAKVFALTPATGKAGDMKWAAQMQADGELVINDRNGDGFVQLGAALDRTARKHKGFAEAEIDPDTIVLSTPEVAGLPSWVIALVATGGLAAALSTAAGLLLVISSSIAHDLYIHFVDPEAPEKRRLLVGRLMIIVAIIIAGYFGINPPGYVAATVAFAFGLAAASFFPIILLGIFDKRANREGAVAGMIVGITFTAVYIILAKSDKILGTAAPILTPDYYLFGILPEGIGTIGCLLNMAVMIVVSRLTSPPPPEVQKLVESVRVPRGSHEPEAHFDETDAEADNP